MSDCFDQGSQIGVKIFGLYDPKSVRCASDSGADFLGFVFHKSSSRYVSYDRAGSLIQHASQSIQCVGLFVDPQDSDIEEALDSISLDIIQLHGYEAPSRVAEIKNRFNRPVMKAIPVYGEEDLISVSDYEDVSDWLLFDTKTKTGQGFGGTGHSFDWSVLTHRHFRVPWMLAGGLTAENLGHALSILSPDALDVSSGVESMPGIKDHEKIKAFIKATKLAKTHL